MAPPVRSETCRWRCSPLSPIREKDDFPGGVRDRGVLSLSGSPRAAGLAPGRAEARRACLRFSRRTGYYSASELAELAGVSNATVSRFVRRLGYASYEEARRHARTEKVSGSRLYLGHVAAETPEDPIAYAEADIGNVRRTLAALDPAGVELLAQAILSARKVWIAGFRAANPLAMYLLWQLTQVKEEIMAIPGGGQTVGEHLASVRAGDVFILFGLRRRVVMLDTVLAAVQRSGARVAYITDESVTRRAEAEWHFRCLTTSPGPLFSHVGAMALLNMIANRTIDAAAEHGRERLNAIESLNDLLGEL